MAIRESMDDLFAMDDLHQTRTSMLIKVIHAADKGIGRARPTRRLAGPVWLVAQREHRRRPGIPIPFH
jgi:hypothetical protein